MKRYLLIIALIFSVLGTAQRVVFPGQELLNPQVNDPSSSGDEKRVQVTGLYQFSGTEAQIESKWASAQIPLFENVGFGLDYFNDVFDFYSFSTVLLTTNFKVGLGDVDHFLKIGLAGGGESQRQDRIPLSQLPTDPEVIPNINDSNFGFAYRAGIHYNYRNLRLGGFLTQLPTQQLIRNIDGINAEDDLRYDVRQGYTGYIGYRLTLTPNVTVTPIARYHSYIDAPIYEGALRLGYKDKVEASLSYKDNFSVNPAVRFQFIKALRASYSYEKAIGVMNFEDIHSIGLSYNFSEAEESEQPEWMKRAKESIAKTDRIKQPKPKREKKAKNKEAIAEKDTENTLAETTKAKVAKQDKKVVAVAADTAKEDEEKANTTTPEAKKTPEVVANTAQGEKEAPKGSTSVKPNDEVETKQATDVKETVEPLITSKTEVATKQQRDAKPVTQPEVTPNEMKVEEKEVPKLAEEPVAKTDEQERANADVTKAKSTGANTQPLETVTASIEEKKETEVVGQPSEATTNDVKDKAGAKEVAQSIPVVKQKEPVATKTKPIETVTVPIETAEDLNNLVSEVEPDPNVDVNTLQLRPGYYVIASVFNSLSAAEAYVQKLKKLDVYSAVGKKDSTNQFYVFIDSDTDKEEAIKRRRAWRLDPNFKDVSLLEIPQ